MGIDFKTNFEKFYGDADDEIITVDAFLRDVNPSLVEGGASDFSSKELNQRRTAVSNRDIRTPNTRSPGERGRKETSTSPPQETSEKIRIPSGSLPSFDSSGGFPGDHPEATKVGEGGPGADADPLGNQIGDSIASTLGKVGLASGIGTMAAGLGMGFGPKAVAPYALGSAVTTALNPALVANTVGGAIYSGQKGYHAGEAAKEQGVSEELSNQLAMGVQKGTSSSGGLIGNIASGIVGMLDPNNVSDNQFAKEATDLTAVNAPFASSESGGRADFGGSSTGTGFGSNTDSGLVGPQNTNAEINAAFGQSPGAQLDPIGAAEGTGTVGISPVGTGNPAAIGTVTGLFGQSAEVGVQGGKGTTSVGGTTGQSATGRGSSGTSGSTGQGTGSGLGQSPTGRGDIGGPGAK